MVLGFRNTRESVRTSLMILSIIVLAGCGGELPILPGDDGSSSSPSLESSSAGEIGTRGEDAFYVATEDDLPECNQANTSRLVYVASSSHFVACDGYGWQTVTIQAGVGPEGPEGPQGIQGPQGPQGQSGVAGMTFSKAWKYHTDTFSGEPDLCGECGLRYAYLGDIRMYKFSDGSFFVTTSGIAWDLNTDPVEKYSFSHTFFVPANKSSVQEIFKIDTYSSFRIRYTVGTSTTTPTFKAVIDTDGNFFDNTDRNYIMTAVP